MRGYTFYINGRHGVSLPPPLAADMVYSRKKFLNAFLVIGRLPD